jgi:hypothetical protein
MAFVTVSKGTPVLSLNTIYRLAFIIDTLLCNVKTQVFVHKRDASVLKGLVKAQQIKMSIQLIRSEVSNNSNNQYLTQLWFPFSVRTPF